MLSSATLWHRKEGSGRRCSRSCWRRWRCGGSLLKELAQWYAPTTTLGLLLAAFQFIQFTDLISQRGARDPEYASGTSRAQLTKADGTNSWRELGFRVGPAGHSHQWFQWCQDIGIQMALWILIFQMLYGIKDGMLLWVFAYEARLGLLQFIYNAYLRKRALFKKIFKSF